MTVTKRLLITVLSLMTRYAVIECSNVEKTNPHRGRGQGRTTIRSLGKGGNYQTINNEEDLNNDGDGQSNGIDNDIDTTLQNPQEKTSDAIEIGDHIFVNPCTGSISTDSAYDVTFPCLDVTNMPSPPPVNTPSPTLAKIIQTLSPTITAKIVRTPSPSISPTTASSSSPSKDTGIIDGIFCPGYTRSCDEQNNNTMVVNFKYSVETANSTKNPDLILPQLELTLLQKLAEKILPAECLDNFSLRELKPNIRSITMEGTEEKSSKRYGRRNLSQVRRRLQTVGICSLPKDEHIAVGKAPIFRSAHLLCT